MIINYLYRKKSTDNLKKRGGGYFIFRNQTLIFFGSGYFAGTDKNISIQAGKKPIS